MRFPTRLLLTCAAIGAAGGLLLIPVNHFSAAVFGVFPLAYAAVTGFWLLPFVFALALLRRPGVALLASFLAGCIDAVATPYGASAILTNVMVGFFLEIPFAVTGYRYWKPWLFYVGATIFGLLYAPFALRSITAENFGLGWQLAFVALVVASELLATWAALTLAKRVERTGVTRGLSRPVDAPRAKRAPAGAAPAVDPAAETGAAPAD